MKTNHAGIELIKTYEGCKLTSYLCPAKRLTIGYGHTGPDVFHGQTITQDEAESLLRKDLTSHEYSVSKLVKVPISENAFSALVSFSYNLGPQHLKSSTLLRKLNQGDHQGAADEFPRWTKADGKELPGLVKRRAAERKLFLS